MNYSMIRYIVGTVLKLESVLLLLPTLVGIIYWESSVWSCVITSLLCLGCGFLCSRKKPENQVFHAMEGYISVALSWIVLSIFGAIPFLISGSIPSITNALFETVSGFTTTGASILSDVEALPRCLLFWRSFTHWIGGMGVLVFVLGILHQKGGSTMYLMKAESPGPSINKLVPRLRNTALILYAIYTLMTLTEVVLLLVGGMPLFDALTTSFGTAGTGGFGIKNDSIGGYAPHLQVIVTIFMILFGINFNIYYLFLLKKWKQVLKSEELRTYLGIIIAATAIITGYILNTYHTFGNALNHASFQVASIITTTGFATTDFNLWAQVPKTILIILMFVGACAGSTGGGIKVSRILIMIKTVLKEIFTFAHPHGVKKIKMDGQRIQHETVRSVNVFMVAYTLILLFSTLLIGIDNLDFTTNFTAVVATFNNIGPGLEMVGPTQNFNVFSNFSKFVMMFDMLAGRLEIFPMLVLFSPYTLRRH